MHVDSGNIDACIHPMDINSPKIKYDLHLKGAQNIGE
jgi:hypothetical protein